MFINLHTHLHRLPHSLLVKTSFHAVASRFPLEALPHADDVDDVDDDDDNDGTDKWSTQSRRQVLLEQAAEE